MRSLRIKHQDSTMMQYWEVKERQRPIVKVLERQVISVFQEEEGIGHTKIGGLASTVTTLLVPLRQPCSLQFQELYM